MNKAQGEFSGQFQPHLALDLLFRGNAKNLSSSMAWALVILPVTVYYQLSSLISSAYELTSSMIH